MATSEQIYKRAMDMKRKYQTSNPEDIIGQLGISLLEQANFDKLLGCYTYQLKHRFIFINDKLSDIMRKMVLAHELGHDTLHRELAKTTQLQEFALFDMQSRPEYEANVFAAHLLLDSEEVYDLVKGGDDVVNLAKRMDVNINLMLIKLQEMNKLGYDLRIPMAPKSDFFKDINTEGDEHEKL